MATPDKLDSQNYQTIDDIFAICIRCFACGLGGRTVDLLRAIYCIGYSL